MKSSRHPIFIYGGVLLLACGGSFWIGRATAPDAAILDGAPSAARAFGSAGARTQAQTIIATGAVNLSLDELIARAEDDALLRQWAAGLKSGEFAGALAALQQLPAGAARDEVIEAMIEEWAERDPATFLAASGSVVSPSLREEGVEDALRNWAAENPQAALAWLRDPAAMGAVSNNTLEDRYQAAIEGYAAVDPKGAFDFIAGLGEATDTERDLKNEAYEVLAESLGEQGKFQEALQMFSHLPENQRNNLYEDLVQEWASGSPTDAAAFVASLPPGGPRRDLGEEVVEQWLERDPAAAANWAAQFDVATASAGGDSLLSEAIQSWVEYDFDGPAQFLKQLTPSPATDHAVATFAMNASELDPAGALDWAVTISDANMRQRATGALAFRMLQDNAADFGQFLQNTTHLSAQQKAWFTQVAAAGPEAIQRAARQLDDDDFITENGRAPWEPAPVQAQAVR